MFFFHYSSRMMHDLILTVRCLSGVWNCNIEVVHCFNQVYSILYNDEPQLSLFNVEPIHFWIYDQFRANNIYFILYLVSSLMWLKLSALLVVLVDVTSVPDRRFDAQSDAI